jgi:RHS repeat-associated protein
MTTTKYIWDEQNYLAEADGNDAINVVYTNEPRHHGNLISTRISGASSYHHFDAIGSARQLTNLSGTLTDTAIYDAWGAIISRSGSTTINLLWVGELGYYYDSDVGLSYVRLRHYSSTTIRWASADPMEFDGGLNRLTYASNSPLAIFDPSGALSALKPLDIQAVKCSSVSWSHRWLLSQSNLDVAPGIVIQRVAITRKSKRCKEKKEWTWVSTDDCSKGLPVWVEGDKPKEQVYWEFWYVVQSGALTGADKIAIPEKQGHDIISMSSKETDSEGSISIVQQAWFVGNTKDPGKWNAPEPKDPKTGNRGQSGDLNWICGDKAAEPVLAKLASQGFQRDREQVVKSTTWGWDCCKKPEVNEGMIVIENVSEGGQIQEIELDFK